MDRTIGTPGGNRPDLARFDPPSRNEAEGGHVDLDRRSLMPGEAAGLGLTRFRGHFSILALKEVHDAPQSPCICAGIPTEVDRAGARRSIRNWVAQAEANGGKRPELRSSLEREGLSRLREGNSCDGRRQLHCG